MSTALERQIAHWQGGLAEEIRFWRRWVTTEGLEWPEDFRIRLGGGYDMSWLLAECVFPGMARAPIVVDIGSGPVTTFSRNASPYGLVRVHAVDALALHYNELLHEFSVSPPVRTEFGVAEDLSLFFESQYADLVHCNNALDHSFDPFRSIEEMLFVTKPTGLVFLRHRRNEAEVEGYSGLHQWNFDEQEGRFVIWNRDDRIDVGCLVEQFADCKCILQDGFVMVRLRKNLQSGDTLTRLVRDRHRVRFSELYMLVVRMAAEGSRADRGRR